jgi:hypothetical protein
VLSRSVSDDGASVSLSCVLSVSIRLPLGSKEQIYSSPIDYVTMDRLAIRSDHKVGDEFEKVAN